jgi:uncharacterized RDD family membrane protein YckC
MDSTDTKYSGLGRRLAAHVVDLIIVFSLFILNGAIFKILRVAGIWKLTNGEDVSGEELWQSFAIMPKVAVVLAFVVTIGLVYFPVFESSVWQATPGKRMLNIFVARDDRTRVGLGRAVGRWLVKWVAGWFGGSLISMGMIGGMPNHKAIHDCTAGTIVLRGRPADQRPIEPWRIVAAFGIPLAWLYGTFYTVL